MWNLWNTEPGESPRLLSLGGSKGGGGGGGEVRQVTTTNEPWGPQQEPLKQLYGGAIQGLNEVRALPLFGSRTVDPTQLQLQGLRGQQTNVAGFENQLKAALPGVFQYYNRVASGDAADPAQNPWLQNTIQATLNPIRDQFFTDVLPAITDRGILEGAFGGARNQLVQADAATRGFGREAFNAIAPQLFNYQLAKEEELRNLPSLYGQLYNISQLPANEFTRIGQAQRTLNQQKRDDQFQIFQEQLAKPFIGLPEASSIIQAGYPGGTSTQTLNSQLIPQQGLNGAFSGAVGGAALGALGGNQFADATGYGLLPYAGAGAILGGLLGRYA